MVKASGTTYVKEFYDGNIIGRATPLPVKDRFSDGGMMCATFQEYLWRGWREEPRFCSILHKANSSRRHCISFPLPLSKGPPEEIGHSLDKLRTAPKESRKLREPFAEMRRSLQ
ncbi:hypothetical protein VNO77_02456 [Canavalia gladiata]|uniref:Uncharacterized protein n=1 Tax=Canavalia gladiata TaxID=3824 RepID=A0AAN9MTQ3_CANGL